MKLLLLLILIPSSLIIVASAQTPADYAQPSVQPQAHASFRPSVAVVVGIFSIMFSLTFLLIMYAKFCHTAAYELFNVRPGNVFVLPPGGGAAARTFSGINKSVIESLPFFRFSSLKGSRDGLECAVCLSKFDDAELLRLLPACKHAFHIACIDRWLESHSTCPLCRHRVDPHDASLFNYSGSSRFLFNSCNDHSNNNQDNSQIIRDLELEIFVEREPSSRSFRFGTKNTLEIQEGRVMHKFKHRIIVSGVVFKSRWSDLNSSDLMSLNSDMLNMTTTSKRFEPAVGAERQLQVAREIKKEMEKKRVLETRANEISRSFTTDVESEGYNLSDTPTSSLISPGHRCMSEITNVSRFHGAKNATAVAAGDEKVRRLWMPIAQRTVQWFAGREGRSTGENVGHSNV